VALHRGCFDHVLVDVSTNTCDLCPLDITRGTNGHSPPQFHPRTIAAWSRSASGVISKWMLAVSARGWMCPVVDRQDRKQILLVTARSGIGIPDAGQQLRFSQGKNNHGWPATASYAHGKGKRQAGSEQTRAPAIS